MQGETPFIHPPLKNNMYPRKHVLGQVLEQVVEVWFVHPTHPPDPPTTNTFEQPEPLQVWYRFWKCKLPLLALKIVKEPSTFSASRGMFQNLYFLGFSFQKHVLSRPPPAKILKPVLQKTNLKPGSLPKPGSL